MNEIKGIMTEDEKRHYESIYPAVNLFWVPASWFASALNDAIDDRILTDPSGNKLIMQV